MILIAIIRDWHQTMSWRLGFGHGKRWRAYRCPWWADEAIYRLGHNYSRGVEIPPFICGVVGLPPTIRQSFSEPPGRTQHRVPSTTALQPRDPRSIIRSFDICAYLP
jgi:hypothetical protein